MRIFVLLSVLGLAAAGPSQVEQGECLVNSGEAISDATDAALFIWAAAKRCPTAGQTVKCQIDISAAVKSVNSMINVIMKVLDRCDALHNKNKACGLQASSLTEHTAGLSAAAGMVYQKCTAVAGAAPAMAALGPPVMCTIDLKNTAKHLFKAVRVISKTKAACADPSSKGCAVNALDVVGSISGMGAWLAGAVGHCTRTTALNSAAAKADTRTALCAQAASALLEHTMKVSQDGIQLSQKCKPPVEEPAPAPAPPGEQVVIEEQQARLYEQEGKNGAGASSMNLVLGAFLPVTAIVSFVGGRFYAAHRTRMEQTREFLSDGE